MEKVIGITSAVVTRKMKREEEQNFENKIRIVFGIVIVGLILYAISACAVKKVDCDAYGYQQKVQEEVVS